MATIILTGPEDDLGSRVASRLEGLAGVDQVIAVGGGGGSSDALALQFGGASVVVHLDGGVAETRSVLAAATSAGVSHLVLLSSTTAYGAWAANPVPLTEDAMLRPNPELEFAVRAAERERLASEWRMRHPGTTVATLRSAVAVADGADGWLARGLRSAGAVRARSDDEAPQQFLHLDDLAAAVMVACEQHLDGAYNVAPDGWLDADEVRALTGRPRLVLPKPFARLAVKLRRATPEPGLEAYARHPWVVSNERLRAVGWEPVFTNEEAVVESTAPMPWADVSPQRRQEIALGVMVVVWLGAQFAVFKTLRGLARKLRHKA